jgi:hypothetical protein
VVALSYYVHFHKYNFSEIYKILQPPPLLPAYVTQCVGGEWTEGSGEAIQCTPQHKAEQLTSLKRIKNLSHTHKIYNLFKMEISANSFDFDDLFPGSPEAGYFFPIIEKVLSNPYGH